MFIEELKSARWQYTFAWGEGGGGARGCVLGSISYILREIIVYEFSCLILIDLYQNIYTEMFKQFNTCYNLKYLQTKMFVIKYIHMYIYISIHQNSVTHESLIQTLKGEKCPNLTPGCRNVLLPFNFILLMDYLNAFYYRYETFQSLKVQIIFYS